MQVSSSYSGDMLYNPYKVLPPRPEESTQANGRASADMASAERQILAQEQSLKSAAAGGSTNTTYTYAYGPDGQKYIVGAEVSVVGTEDELNVIPGGTRTGRSAGSRISADASPKDDATSGASSDATEDPKTAAVIAELENTQREVIAHEAAHQAAAGRFGGAVSYTYTKGPDGKNYITGGEVPISTPATNDPEEALQNANQVMRAAMAPGDPSGQDVAVAASAAQMAASARAQIAAAPAKEGEAAGEGGGQSADADDSAVEASNFAAINGFSFEHATQDAFSALPDDEYEIDPYTGRQAETAYKATGSKKGLWTASGGFEPKERDIAPPTILEPQELERVAQSRDDEIAA